MNKLRNVIRRWLGLSEVYQHHVAFAPCDKMVRDWALTQMQLQQIAERQSTRAANRTR